MVCPRCKKIVPDDTPFCMNCGKMVIKDKRAQSVTAVIIIAAVIAVAAAVVLAVLLSGGKRRSGDFITAQGTLNHRYSASGGELILFDKDKEILRLDDVASQSVYDVIYNADRTCAVIRSGDTVMYYYDGKATHTIELQGEMFTDVRLSYDGSAVAYSVMKAAMISYGWYDALHPIGRFPDVYRIKADDGESELIAERASLICISPDGGTVAYRKLRDADGGIVMRDCCFDGTVHEFDERCTIYAVANGGKYIYCGRYFESEPYTMEGEYVYGNYRGVEYMVLRGYDDKTGVSLGQSTEYYSCVFNFNCDLSEAIVSNFDGEYLWNGGDEAVKIIDAPADVNFEPVLPRDVGICYENSYRIYGFKTFAGKFLVSTHSESDSYLNPLLSSSSIMVAPSSGGSFRAVYLDKDLKCTTVTERGSSFALTDDGKTLFFLSDQTLYKVSADDKGMAPKEAAEGKYKYFAASSDGRTLFLVTSGNDLYTKTGDAEERFVVDGIDGKDMINTSLYQGRYLYIYRGNLLYRTGGGYPRRVGSMRSDIEGFEFFGNTVYVYTSWSTEHRSAVYISERGNGFKLHAEY